MMQDSSTERGGEVVLSQTDPTYPALTASPRRTLLVAITAVGTVLGALPALVIIDVLWLVSVYAAIGLVAPALYLRRFRATQTVPPSPAEFMIAGVGTLLTPLLGSVLWIGVYYVVLEVADLFGANGRDVALIGTIPLAIGFGLFYSLVAAENLASQLYPDTAGARSAHYGAAQHSATLIAGSLITAAVVVFTLTFFDSGESRAWVLLVYGFFLSALAFGPEAETPSGAETDQISALGVLLTNHGLRVTAVPRSDDVALDPYLSDIDLIATHGDTDYAVSLIRGNENPKGVRWTEAANLKLGAFAVARVSEEESESTRPVLPLLVVTASQEDERLVEYCVAEKIDLVLLRADGVRVHTSGADDSWIEHVDWQTLQPASGKKEQVS